MPDQPLAGVRIVEVTVAQFGPQSSQHLADMGAEVIKIEPVGGAMASRTPVDSVAKAYFHSANRNKRGMSLNLATPEGREVCLRLVERADVFIQNLRPGVMARLGLDYASLSRVNPRLVYASCSGFGMDGPYARRRGLDMVGQGLGGLIALTGTDESGPIPAGATVVDLASSCLCAFGIVAALRARDRDGVGQEVNASLLDTAITLQSWEATTYLNLGIVSERAGTGHDLSNHYLSSVYQVFRTAHGHIVVSTIQESRWRDFCNILDIPELAEDPRFDTGSKRVLHHAELTELLQAALLKRDSSEWLARLNEIDIACAPVNSQPETFSDPQVLHNQMVVDWPDERGPVRYLGLPVKLSRTPASIRSTAPDLGQHTDEVLTELGYDGPTIADLRRNGVV